MAAELQMSWNNTPETVRDWRLEFGGKGSLLASRIEGDRSRSIDPNSISRFLPVSKLRAFVVADVINEWEWVSGELTVREP